MLDFDINYKSILIQGIITIGLIIGAYFYGQHRQYISDRVEAQQEIIDNQSKVINKLELSKKNDDSIIDQLHKDLTSQNSKYDNIIRDLQNDKDTLTHKLNNTNHINGLLVRTISLGIEGQSVPKDAIASSTTHADSASYKASDLASGIIDVAKQCNEIRSNYMALQNWNKKEIEIFNK